VCRFHQDLTTAVRALRRSPGFTAMAVLTLALGIGASTAIFSIVSAVLMRPLPSPGLERLYVIRGDVPSLEIAGADLAAAEVQDLAERRDVFEAVAGFRAGGRILTGHGPAARVNTVTTIGDFAGVFGVRPELGRFHRPEQSLEGPYESAVLSHGLWQQLSGGDPSFVGRLIELNGVAHEVIGVMPPEFRYPRDVHVWVPFPYTERFRQPQGRGIWNMTTVARVRPEITAAQLAAHLEVEAERWRAQYSPSAPVGKQLRAVSIIDAMAGPLRPVLLVLMGAVVFVMLIAATNVASLQVVRASGRMRELAVRAALGAGRVRLTRQLLLESLLLAVLGGLAGVWLAALGLELFLRWEPSRPLYLEHASLDGQVLAFTAFMSLVAAVVFGTAPAVRASHVQPQSVLRAGARGTTARPGRHRLLQLNVAVQIALALVLLLGTGLMVRTLAKLLATDPGFAPSNVTTAQITIPGTRYDSEALAAGFFDDLLAALQSAAGIETAALVWGLPFTDQTDSSPFRIEGREPVTEGRQWHSDTRVVSPDYFATMRIPLLRGRDFDATERPGSPLVAIVDETFADQFFPGEDPVGRRIESGFFGFEPTTIVGVVSRVDHEEIGAPARPVIYYSHQHQAWSPWRSIVVRSSLPPAAVAAVMRAAVSTIDPNVPLYDVQTMSDRIRSSVGPRRLAMLALGAFAALALLLAALGVYGVMRYTTSRRQHEIGVRMAIGADARSVLFMVLREAFGPTLVGLAAGLFAALALARFMAGMLFGISSRDPLAFAAATMLLAVAAMVAALLPARSATRVDPMKVLRND
jgi:predicted permease